MENTSTFNTPFLVNSSNKQRGVQKDHNTCLLISIDTKQPNLFTYSVLCPLWVDITILAFFPVILIYHRPAIFNIDLNTAGLWYMVI